MRRQGEGSTKRPKDKVVVDTGVLILVADLVAEQCFHEIAKKKVESSGATLRPEAVSGRIQRDAFELSRKYGKKVHEVLVDQRIIIEARRAFEAT